MHHAITSGAHTSVSAGGSLLVAARHAVRMFAGKLGMRLIAAAGDIDIRALSQSVHLLARLEITETAEVIRISATKQLEVSGGGSYGRWNAGGIEFGSSGPLVMRVPKLVRSGAHNIPLPQLAVHTLSDINPRERMVVRLSSHAQAGFARGNEPYELLRNGQSVAKGITNAQGQIELTGPFDGVSKYEVRTSDGQMRGVFMRTREGDALAIERSLSHLDEALGKDAERRSFIETQGMQSVATAHQKTILIDYEHEGGAHAVGYVMGLNSVTDYWDTREHVFHDPRRGEPWEGAAEKGHATLKPYQDVACRLRGDALVAVSKNFTTEWNRASGLGSGKGDDLQRVHDLTKPPRGLYAGLKGPLHGAQIVRTEARDGDQSVRRLYQQASQTARHYIYIENQYIQYAAWASQLREVRQKFCEAWKAGCKRGPGPATKPPDLHVFMVAPTAERTQMVPRTHDMVKALGNGESMPNQDKEVEKELREWRARQAAYDATPVNRRTGSPPSLSELAKTSLKAGQSHTAIRKELDDMGLRVLMASLWSFDTDHAARQREQAQRAQAWQGMPALQERHKLLQERLLKARYREIYIHSKLMIADDAFFTLGSANLNTRSMAVDSEINVASADPQVAHRLRSELWEMHTRGARDCNPGKFDWNGVKLAHGEWVRLMNKNKEKMNKGEPLQGHLVPFYDDRTSKIRLG